MKEIKDNCYKGTRILIGLEKRAMINKMVSVLLNEGYNEISIPIIQYQDVFKNKIGENKNLMFNFTDMAERALCLAPEYTSVAMSLNYFKYQNDVKLFYIQECFRGEKPQAGRYRQFTQLGVEILNPTRDYKSEVIVLAEHLLSFSELKFSVRNGVTRGLDYYKNGEGFEIVCEDLGSSKQICGGGEYDGGIGFAIGIDRILKTD